MSESAGVLYIIVEAVPDENGNIPDVGIPLGIRITSKDGSAIGKNHFKQIVNNTTVLSSWS